MVRRSVLFSPGDQPELLWKATRTDADTLVFDLENAVAPARKADARAAVRDVLSDPDFDPSAEVCVRVNPGRTAATDIDALAEADVRLDAVMLPKAESLSDVLAVEDRLSEHGLDLPVLALVETPAGVLAAPEIAAAGATDALAFGAEDLAAAMGATRTDEGTEVLYARERVVLAASAAGVDALDTPYTDFQDDDGLRAETRFAATLGYDGKLAIHPAQVPVVNDAFTPDDETVEWARNVLAARDEHGDDRGVFEVDGEMIDAPLVAQAERVVRRAEAADRD